MLTQKALFLRGWGVKLQFVTPPHSCVENLIQAQAHDQRKEASVSQIYMFCFLCTIPLPYYEEN